MKRDINKAITEGTELVRKYAALDLSAYDVMQIAEAVKQKETTTNETLWNCVLMSYRAGLAVGYRNGKTSK